MILKIFLISLFCVAIRKITDEGMVFYPVKEWLNRVIKSEVILSPLINCVYCFASFWGSVAYVLLTHFILSQHINCAEWAFCCICAAPLNGFLWNLLISSEN